MPHIPLISTLYGLQGAAIIEKLAKKRDKNREGEGDEGQLAEEGREHKFQNCF